MKYIIAAFLITIFFACNSKMEENKQIQPNDKQSGTDKQKDSTKQDTRKQNDKPSRTALKDDEAILDAHAKMDWLFGKGFKNWTPDISDIVTAEKLLNDCYVQEKTGTVNHLLGKTLEEYNKQYVGAVEENGEKTIWINCFCKKYEKDFPDWKKQIIGVADGGNCFFNLKINITRNVFGLLQVNGTP